MVEQQTRTTGSVSAGGGRGAKRGLWWLLAVLALGVIAAGVIFLIARNAGDEGDDDANLDTTNEESASGENGDDPATDERDGGDGSGAAADEEGAASTGRGGSEGAGAASGQLSSEGTALLPTPADGLASYADKPVEARSVPVQSVVADEGFWLGPSERERAFVFFAADNAGTESPLQVEAGRRVSFTGTLKALPAAFESSFDIDASEGATQLAEQGYYVEVPPNAIRQG